MKIKFRRSNLKRNRLHGFRARMAAADGRAVISRRRRRGRKKLTVSDEGKFKRQGGPRTFTEANRKANERRRQKRKRAGKIN